MKIGNKNIQYTVFNNIVEQMKYKYMSLWWDTCTDFPDLNTKYSFWAKKHTEKKIDNFTKMISKELQQIPEGKEEVANWQKDIMYKLKGFAKDTLGFKESHLDILFSDGYSNVTNEFVKEARKFDPKIDIYDIFQAIRNVWIMNSIQIFLGTKVQFTPSILAYSMLYPYTDNYLDDPKYSLETKKSFNKKFKTRLYGTAVDAENKNEEDIFKLISLIEDQYSRECFREVYDSLLAIHEAQDKSLTQQKGIIFPYERDILGISFEKGGTSVLADGYLVNGTLSPKEIDFIFGYGVFLQLADDLQDIQEDFDNGHMTIFSSIASKWPLDRITNRLFWLLDEILKTGDFTTEDSATLKDIIKFSCNYLIFGAIAKNKKFYTRKYVKSIEQYSPFSFSYQNKLENKLKKQFSPIDINNICTALQQ